MIESVPASDVALAALKTSAAELKTPVTRELEGAKNLSPAQRNLVRSLFDSGDPEIAGDIEARLMGLTAHFLAKTEASLPNIRAQAKKYGAQFPF